jgi:hypothetical protein
VFAVLLNKGKREKGFMFMNIKIFILLSVERESQIEKKRGKVLREGIIN